MNDSNDFIKKTTTVPNLEQFFMPYTSQFLLPGEVIPEGNAPAKRVLVLAPHPDDEVFGCGGAVSQLASAQAEIKTLILTDGLSGLASQDASQSSPTQASLLNEGAVQGVNIRRRESIQAAHCLGTPKPIFLDRQDGALMQDADLLTVILEAIGDFQPDLILAPSIWEMHRDHRAVSQAGLALAAQLPSVANIAMYEVGVPLIPNAFIDISETATKKSRAMRCFASQNSQQSYAEQIQGLNRFRSYTLGMQVKAAEAYHIVAKVNVADFMTQHPQDINNHALFQAEQHLAVFQQQLQQQSLEIEPLRKTRQLLEEENTALMQANLQQQEAHQADKEHLENAQIKLAQIEEHMTVMESTLSWRMTAPLRWIRRYI